MFGHQPRNRWQAFGIHLLVSLTLFIAMCTIIVVFWYPGVLFTTEGGWQGVRLIAGIDFIIGPTLTLLVYKPGKKGMKFDLTVIGCLQALCISYGMYVVNYSRPAVVAYGDSTYFTVPLLRFDSRDIDITQSPLLKERLPVWTNIHLPEDKEERLKVRIERFWKGIETSIDLYESYDRALPFLAHEGMSLAEARAKQIPVPDSLDPATIRVFRLITRYDHYAVAVDIRDGHFVALLGSMPPGAEPSLPAETTTGNVPDK